tara:strand:+ start:245 stop:1159 length:915 start_codon:yes stop_codon:yes gene_type:complete
LSEIVFQRDAVINKISDLSSKNKDIYFISADFGAPSLDYFRKSFPEQFIHAGISEQNAVTIAGGIAKKNKTPILYAMAPFISLRCLEQHKCSSALMKLPVITIVSGIGLGYADAGPTHYATEDLACLRTMQNCEIYTPSDNDLAVEIISDLLKNQKFSFIRLDRHLNNSMKLNELFRLDGSRVIKESKTNSDTLIISHGYILHKSLDLVNNLEIDISILDIFKTKGFGKDTVKYISKFKKVICIDEQYREGNLSSIIYESLSKLNLNIQIKDISIDSSYLFENGGRDYLINKFCLNKEKLTNLL